MKKKIIEYDDKKLIKHFIVILFTILFSGILYYFMLPPINPSSFAFWIYLVLIIGFYTLIAACSNLKIENNILITKTPRQNDKFKYIWYGFIVIFLAISFVNIINSPIFSAKSYYNRIFVNETGVFENDVPLVDTSKLPLLDKDSSSKLGDRVMGQMTDLVSQFTVSDLYTQINYNDEITRVTPLEYANVIKYFTNHKSGVSGYIKVNSVTGKTELVRLDQGMKYMPSAILNENLYRKLRFSYLTEIFGEASFEIDNEGNP